MTDRILVAYATRYGSTEEVAHQVAATLRESGVLVDCRPAREVRSLTDYTAVVLGAAIYMYRWHKVARRFLSRHREVLEERPVAVFALGPTREPHDEEEWQDSRAQLEKELARFPWLSPADVKLFGGKFDPEELCFPINIFAGSEPATDIRDWAAICAWANSLSDQLWGSQ